MSIIKKIHNDFIQKKYTVEDKVKEYISNIQKSKLNAFISYKKLPELHDKIQNSQKRIESNDIRPLEGISFSIKDTFCTKEFKTTAGSEILKNFTPKYNAAIVEKIQSSGGIILGKTNCDEFAMGSANSYSAFGQVLNPHDSERVPGGSSGGSAASVAANLCNISIGSDSGGSVRQPGAFCGCVGFKPTYGCISRHGLITFSSSCDTVGIFSLHVKDAEIVYNVLSGVDKRDSTSQCKKTHRDKKNIKIAFFKNYKCTQEVDKYVKKYASFFAAEQVEEIDFSHALYAYHIISSSEAMSNLSRYSGIYYGCREENSNLNDFYVKNRKFGEECKRRIMTGAAITSQENYEKYFIYAQKIRGYFIDLFNKIYEKYDAVLLPTTFDTAFKVDEKVSSVHMYYNDIYTTIANLIGCPAISIPCGKDKNNSPIGIQFMSNRGNEKTLFEIGEIVEKKAKYL